MRIRIIEATKSIPLGLVLDIGSGLKVGGKIDQEINGVRYQFDVEGIQPVSATRFKIWNSNVIAIVEIIKENG